MDKLQFLTRLAGGYAFAGGLITLTGWATNIPRLTDWGNHGLSMLPNMAAAVMLAGAALLLRSFGHGRLATGLALFTGFVGAATLFEHVTGVDLGIDSLLLPRSWGQQGTYVPGRLGPPGAVSLAILGAGIVLASRGRKSRQAASGGGLVVFGITLVSIAGYIFGVGSFYSVPRFTTIALPTATILLALGIGLVVSLPEVQPMKILREGSSAGVLVRSVLPFIVVLPILIGWLRLEGENAGLYRTGFGTALRSVTEVVLLTGLLAWAALAVKKRETALRATNEQLMRSGERLGELAILLRQGEERFRAIADNIPQLAWMIESGGEIAWVNQAWLAYTGSTLEENQGSGWKAFHHPDHIDAVAEKFERHIREGRDWEDTFPLRGKAGGYRWFLSRMNVIRDESGKISRFFGTNTDVTEQRATADALVQAKEQADAASRAKDDFLAALSHELRTPLTPVLMATTALREDDRLPADVRHQLGMMERNIVLEARLIDDLLDLTAISRGKLQLHVQPCDAHALIGLALEIVRMEAGAKNIMIERTFTAQRSGLVADPARFQQVIWNLLRNAVKFTPAGGSITIVTSDENKSDGAQWLRIEVTDTGVGIEPAILDRIFIPFEQGYLAGAHRFGGLGLGLAIAREVVKLHDGRITAHSEGPDRGATFVVELPGASALRGGIPGTEASFPAAASPARAAPLRLLLVEDHESTLQTLARMLQRDGHSIVTAGDVGSALIAAETHPFDLLISDLGLPDGTGTELMEKLRARHGLRGIALSGYGMQEDVKRSLDAGFICHLVKPVPISELRRALATLFPLKS